MELIRYNSGAASYLAQQLKDEDFLMIDLGCAGGIDEGWRAFGDRLAAFAFDPSVQECAKLNAAESNPKIEYIAAFVGARADGGPVNPPQPANIPYPRFSCARTMNNRDAAKAAAKQATTHDELIAQNLWDRAELADANKPVFLPDLFKARGCDKVDFIKIDVDGYDFEILKSLSDELGARQVLGVMLEVNFYGSDSADENTFHNMDRFMRAAGFELYGLTVRTYASAALPYPYLYTYPLAAQTSGGRPFQGDALYVRDLGRTPETAAGYSDDQLIKMAAALALFGMSDYGAELLDMHRQRLEGRIDYDAVHELMAREVQERNQDVNPGFRSYGEYMKAFEADEMSFYDVVGRAGRRNQAMLSIEHEKAVLSARVQELEARLGEADFLRGELDAARAKSEDLQQQLAEAKAASVQASAAAPAAPVMAARGGLWPFPRRR